MAVHGRDFVSNYARAIIVYYVVSFVYMFVFFPIYARFGGGKGGARVMFRHLFRPEELLPVAGYTVAHLRRVVHRRHAVYELHVRGRSESCRNALADLLHAALQEVARLI